MGIISIKTAYNGLKELSSTGKSYPADGAILLISQLKNLFIGYSLDKILNTWIADYPFSIQSKQILQKEWADDIEWEGPFVFIINNQKLFIDFSAPEHYEIGINSRSIADIVDNISSVGISKIEKYGHDGQFIDISFLYGSDVVGQIIKDICVIVDNKHPIAHLSAVIIELQNSVCLAISEEIDNPMLRVYSDRKEAMQSIIEQQRKNTEFYK